MYERLTVRDEYGNADIIGVDSADLQLNLGFKELNIVTNTLNRLAEFEDIGLSPEEIIGMKSLCEKTYDDLRHRVNTAEKEVEQLRAELERTKKLVERCEWILIDDDKGLWQCSKCGAEWVLEAGTPADNEMNYCPACGRRLEVES
jgi:rubrerythrin